MKLSAEELLTLQNLTLKLRVATLERDAFGATMLHKYGAPGETALAVDEDGSIARPPVPLSSVPQDASPP